MLHKQITAEQLAQEPLGHIPCVKRDPGVTLPKTMLSLLRNSTMFNEIEDWNPETASSLTERNPRAAQFRKRRWYQVLIFTDFKPQENKHHFLRINHLLHLTGRNMNFSLIQLFLKHRIRRNMWQLVPVAQCNESSSTIDYTLLAKGGAQSAPHTNRKVEPWLN